MVRNPRIIKWEGFIYESKGLLLYIRKYFLRTPRIIKNEGFEYAA